MSSEILESVVNVWAFLDRGLVKDSGQKLAAPRAFAVEDAAVLHRLEAPVGHDHLDDHALDVLRPQRRIASEVVACHATCVGALA